MKNDTPAAKRGGRVRCRSERPKGCPYPEIVCDSDCVNWAFCRSVVSERAVCYAKARLWRRRYNDLLVTFESRTPCDFCRFAGTLADEEPCCRCPAEVREEQM